MVRDIKSKTDEWITFWDLMHCQWSQHQKIKKSQNFKVLGKIKKNKITLISEMVRDRNLVQHALSMITTFFKISKKVKISENLKIYEIWDHMLCSWPHHNIFENYRILWKFKKYIKLHLSQTTVRKKSNRTTILGSHAFSMINF